MNKEYINFLSRIKETLLINAKKGIEEVDIRTYNAYIWRVDKVLKEDAFKLVWSWMIK